MVAINTYVAANGNYDVVDKSRYALEFESLSFSSFGEAFDSFITDGREPAFLLFNWVIGQFTHDAAVFFAITAAVCSIMLAITLWLILGSGWMATVVFYVTFCFGFFTNYSSFLLRQGLSISFLLLALALVFRQGRLRSVAVLLAIGVLFHWSAAVAAILILVLCLFKLRIEVLLGVWCLLSITYLTGVNEILAGPLGSTFSDIETYSDPDMVLDYTGGTNRLDFWVMSAVPLIFGYVTLKKFDYLPDWYSKLIKSYVLLNCYYVAMGFLYFGDRLAAYSWSLTPLLMAVPVLLYDGRGQKLIRPCIVLGFMAWGWYFGTFEAFITR
ncbi:MAG: EpsG family protein [Brevibacterium aurantiacum]|nr:EpsG family protein [Brevibacterium aurantiacum]